MKQSEQDVIDYFDEEAEVEIGSAQEFTSLAKDLRKHQATVLGLAAERDALAAQLAATDDRAEIKRLRNAAKNTVNLIEGLDGYGLACSKLDNARLKDEPNWCEFFNAVKALETDQ